MKDIYISHSPEDKFTADAIAHVLAREGIGISDSVIECTAVIFVFTKSSNASYEVCHEIQTAHEMGKIIIPLRIHNIPVNYDLDFYLNGLQWLEISPYRRDFEELLKAIRPMFPQKAFYMEAQRKKKISSEKRIGIIFAAGFIFCLSLVVSLFSLFAPENDNEYVSIRDRTPAGYPAQGAPVTTVPPILSGAEALTPEQIFAHNADAVFLVYTYDAFGNQMSSGSGFFISSDGMAVTNHHVLAEAHRVTIITNNDEELKVNGYYTYDIDNDIAIFQVQGGNFQHLIMGDSDAVQIGESVYAIGSPHGNRNTFSISYVSNLLESLDFNIYRSDNVIQITAPLYPGSSGGALLNGRGEVIGVTSAVDTRRSGVVFAVPISHVDLTGIVSGQYFPLPISFHSPSPRGNHFNYIQFPGITDFLSVSSNAVLREGETFENLHFKGFDYEHMFIYDLGRRHFVSDTDRYDVILMEQGFYLQDIFNDDDVVLVFHFNRADNISLVYTYFFDDEKLVIGIGEGNAFAQR